MIMTADAMSAAPVTSENDPFVRKPVDLIPERRRPRTREELRTDTALAAAYEAGRLCSRLVARAGLILQLHVRFRAATV